ncbi:MAG: hypothetical protein E3K32_02820 [wastewater metagenome]|nr:hypothetical protein [Candidatus Loosdrechtia aerotolerans]
MLEESHKMMKDSLTVSVILALTKAQMFIETDWCEVWKLVEGVFENKELKQDLRPEAKKIILNYMILYREYCR